MRPAWAVASAVAATMASRASSAAADSSSTSPTLTWPRRLGRAFPHYGLERAQALEGFANLRAVAAGAVARRRRSPGRAGAVIGHAARDLGEAFGRLEAAGDLAFLATHPFPNDPGRLRL